MKDKKGGGDKAKSSTVKELNPWPAYIQVCRYATRSANSM